MRHKDFALLHFQFGFYTFLTSVMEDDCIFSLDQDDRKQSVAQDDSDSNQDDSSDSETDQPTKEIKKGQKKKESAFLVHESLWIDYVRGDKEPTLDEIAKMVKEVNASTKTNQKKQALMRHPSCSKIHLYVCNPFWQFYNSSTRVKKTLNNPDVRIQPKQVKSIFELLDLLKTRSVTGNAALAAICAFINKNRKHEQLIYSILDKNLKIRCQAKTINCVFKDLVPTFPVALALDRAKIPEGYIDFIKDDWFASRKYDGVRVLCIVRKGMTEFRSREGKVFVTLQALEKTINDFKLEEECVFDGELCIMEDGKENFKMAVSEAKKKSGTVANPRYLLFDMITLEEFEKGASTRTYSERIQHLKDTLKNRKYDPYLAITEQIRIRHEAHLEKLQTSAIERGWEGLILRKDCGYEGKRGNNMVKIKKFQDEEFKCIGLSVGKMRFIIEGKDTEIETMKNITIDHNGTEVNVGSGFTLEEREYFKDHPKEIVGKVVTIAYFEKTEDNSLRFPTFKCLHGKKRKL